MKKTTKSVIALLITVVMLVCSMPMATFASIANWEENNVVYDGTSFGTNGYYNVISKKDYVLVPGAAVESEIVLNNATGTRRQVLHVIEVDPSNPDVSIVPGYYRIDQDLSWDTEITADIANGIRHDDSNPLWSHKELTDMAKYYEDNLGYNIVGGMNTDLYYNTYAPRVLVYNGKNIGGFGSVEVATTDGKTPDPDGLLNPTSSVLYVFKDADGNISCDVKALVKSEFDAYLESGTLLHAVGVSFNMIVKDGVHVKSDGKPAQEERTSSAAARSMVGVKEDGTLVLVMNDGRGANNSVGFCDYEEGEAMLALGCKWAANCDGGGSSTFISKRVGEETFTMRSVPCDGSQRPTAHGIFIASNVAPTGELDVVNVESDYDIFAPSTIYNFGAQAIDTHGYAMDMPADVSWELSNSSFGTIENGKFVSNGTEGTVDVQVLFGGNVVGTKTITVAKPETFKLSATSTVVPYSTVDKIRTITLPIVAMTGEANVYVDTNVVFVSLSNAAAGTLDGFKFTSTSDESIAGVDVTITYGSQSFTYAIEFGKGSEIIFDFEDGDRAGFMGFEEAKKWSQENGVNNTLVGSNPLAGQFNPYLNSTTFISTTTNGGEVRNGNNALAWRLDNTDASFAGWSYNVLFNVSDEVIVLRDVANGMKATALGMWLYIPENAFPSGDTEGIGAGKGLAFQSQLYVKNANGSYSCKQDHFMFTSAATGKQTNLNSATNADIPESRWVYATIDISKYDYLCMPVATDEGNERSPSFIRTYVKPDTADVVTFYIDDITLDYSSAVDDRVLPTITAPTYSTSDVAVSLDNGAVINGNNVAFSATVADNAALDLTSGKITVDGVVVESSINGNALSTKGDVALVAGQHVVAFEVKDELGNPRKITRTFTVFGNAVIELGGHNDSGETPKAQSIYYVDVNVADLASVNKLVAVLKLNNANTWELDGAIVADGFKATLEYNDISELLTVTVEKDGASGKVLNNTLVSIPVRVWTYDGFDYVTEKDLDPAKMGNKPVVNIICDVVYGVVDGNSFAGSINVATELTTITSPYHIHDAELVALEDKAATCTEAGYTGRTYCETCKSVVDFGTVVEATGHDYKIVDAQFVCETCDDVAVLGTGVVEMNGDLYYAVNGKLVKGWQDMGTYEGDDYINGGAPFTMYGYAGSDYKLYVNTTKTISGITYTFDEDGTTMGAFITNSTGTRYSVGPSFIKRSWVTLAGDQYYFGEDYYMYTGTRSIPKNRNNPAEGIFWYLFAEDGKFVREYTDLNGIIEENGNKYWVVDGRNAYGGLMLIDGAYYYARTYGEIVCGKSYGITKTNDLLPAKAYTFGEDGKMINPPVVEPEQPPVTPDPTPDPEPEVKNGICADENGKLFYYVNGAKAYGGLMLIDGAYYYARTSGEIVCGTSYGITKTNDLLPARAYTFGEDGKMLNAPVVEPEQPPVTPDPTPDPEPEVKNGICADENGKLFYYVNGAKAYGGLMLIDGAYYYARTSGEIVCGTSYGITKTNDLLPARAYIFGEDGKMVNAPSVEPEQPPVTPEPEVKNGICADENGKMFYYVNGVKTYGGLMLIDGAYYYARTSGEIVCGTSYGITKTNDLLPARAYTFGEDGKMQNPPV